MTNAANVVGKKCGREDSHITAGGHGVRLPYCWIFQEASPALRMFLGCGRPVAPLLKSYANVETLSISELNDFVITAPSQDIGFICTGKITGKKLDKGWCYVSCSNCSRKLQRSVSSFTCVLSVFSVR